MILALVEVVRNTKTVVEEMLKTIEKKECIQKNWMTLLFLRKKLIFFCKNIEYKIKK